MFKVPRALVEWGTLRAATLSAVHAGSHLSLAFHYGCKRTTNLSYRMNLGHKILLLAGYTYSFLKTPS
jgi:hypothetical protein